MVSDLVLTNTINLLFRGPLIKKRIQLTVSRHCEQSEAISKRLNPPYEIATLRSQ